MAVDPEETLSYHIGAEEELPDAQMCHVKSLAPGEDGDSIMKRKKLPPCIYVVGLAGLAPFKTHYSAMAEASLNYTLHKELREGAPLKDITKAHHSKYFHFRVFDPEAQKVVVQVTTIHGDPEVFISTKEEKPGPGKFERRGVTSGLFPEILAYERST